MEDEMREVCYRCTYMGRGDGREGGREGGKEGGRMIHSGVVKHCNNHHTSYIIPYTVYESSWLKELSIQLLVLRDELKLGKLF